MTRQKWYILFALAAIVDIAQLGFNLFAGLGIGLNRAIDIAVLPILWFTLNMWGVKLDIPAIFLTFGFEQVPLLDSAPLWTLYIFYIKKIWEAEQVIKSKSPHITKIVDRTTRPKPLVKDGVRMPTGRDTI